MRDTPARPVAEGAVPGKGIDGAVRRDGIQQHRVLALAVRELLEIEFLGQAGMADLESVFDDARLEWMFYEAERQKAHQSDSDALIFPADHFGVP